MATDYTADANCQGAWLFADSAADATGKNSSPTETSITYSTTRPYGFATGKSAVFNGTSSKITYTNANLGVNFPGKLVDLATWSTCFWFNIDNLTHADTPYLFDKNEWAFRSEWGTTQFDKLQALQYDSDWHGNNAIIKSGISAATWYHVGYSVNFTSGDNSTATYWLSTDTGSFGNVVNAGTTNWTNIHDLLSTTDNWVMGATYGGAANFFDGKLYQPIIFNRTISATEAQNMYTYGITGAGLSIPVAMANYRQRRN